MRAKSKSPVLRSWLCFVGVCVALSGCASPLKRSQSLLTKQRPKDALRVLERGLRARPEDTALWLALAEISLAEGDLMRAEAASGIAVLLLPASARAHLIRAKVLLTRGEVYQAALFLERARALGGEPDALLVGSFARQAPRAARLLLKEKKSGEAARVLSLLDALAPGIAPPALFARVFLSRAQKSAKEGELLRSAADYLSAAERGGVEKASGSYLEAGILFLRAGKLSAADEAFHKAKEAAQASGGDLRVVSDEIADRYEEWGETGRAADVWAALALLGGEGAYSAWYEAGRLSSLSLDPARAEDAFLQYIATYPKGKAAATRAVIGFYEGRGDLAAQERYYRLLITYSPYLFRDRRGLCNLWAKQGRYDLVEEMFSSYIEAVRGKPEESVGLAFFNIARWYEGKGKDEEALSAFLAVSKEKEASKEKYDVDSHLAEVYGRLKRFPEMSAALARYIAGERDKRRAILHAARKLFAAGETLQARKYARQAFKDDPSRRDAALLLADILAARSALDEEEVVLSAYATAQKSPGAGWLEVGARYKRRNDIVRAAKAFLAAIEDGFRKAALDLGDLYLAGDDQEKAKAAFWRFLDGAPDRHKALSDILDHYKNNPNYHKERVDILEEMLRLRPDLTSWALSLGQEYLNATELPKAMDAFERYVQAASDRAGAWKTVGDKLRDSGHPDLAQRVYDKALAAYPDSAAGLFDKGMLSLTLKREGQAADFFRAYLKTPGSKSPRALQKAADALKKADVCEVALLFYQEVIALDATRQEALFYLGECALKLGEGKTAKDAFALYLSRKNQDPAAQLQVGHSYMRAFYYAKAIPHLKVAFSLPRKRLKIFDDLVACLSKIGQEEEIPKLASSLLGLAEGDAELHKAHLQVAKAYGNLGRAREHIYYLEQALRFRPKAAENIYFQIAEALVSLGEHTEAKGYLLRSARLHRDPEEGLFLDAVLWEREGELGLARELYLACAEYGGKYEERARLAAGKLLFLLKEPAAGFAEMQEAALRSPLVAGAWEKVARALVSIKEEGLAVKAYEEALLEDPTPREATLELASLLFARGEVKEAQRLLEGYLGRAFAGAGKATHKVARIYADGQRIDEALASYRRALRDSAAKDARQAYREATALLLARGEKAEVLSLSRDLLLLSKVSPDQALLDAGFALARAGLIEDAARCFKDLFALGGGEGNTLSAATFLAGLGEREEARRVILAVSQGSKDPTRVLIRAARSSPYDLALSLLDEAAKRAPGRAQVFRTRGEILLGHGEIPEAVWAFSRAVKLSARPGEEAEHAYNTLFSYGATEEAALFIDLITKPKAALFAKAISFLTRKDTGRARKALQDYIARLPLGEGARKAGEAALRFGQPALAEELLKEAAEALAEPGIVSLWLDASLASGREVGPEALAAFAEKMSPTKKRELAEGLLARGELKAALPLARSLFKESPHKRERFLLFFTALSSAGLADGSGWEEEAYQAALSFADARPWERASSLQTAADLAARTGFSSLAARLYQEALSSSPENPEIALALGRARLVSGDEEGAREAFQLARAHAVEPGVIWREIGDAYASMLLFAQATAAYEEALRAGSATPSLLASLGEARLSGGDLPGGLEAFRLGVEKAPNPPRAAARYALLILRLLGAKGAKAALDLLEGQKMTPEVKAARTAARLMNGEEDAARSIKDLSLRDLLALPKPALRLAAGAAPEALRALAKEGTKEAVALARAVRDAGEAKLAVDLLEEAGEATKKQPLFRVERENKGKDARQEALLIARLDAKEASPLGALLSAGRDGAFATKVALSTAYAAIKANKPEARRLVRLVATLSSTAERATPGNSGQMAYSALISHALAQGKTSLAREAANEMHQLAIAAGADVGLALFCRALLTEDRSLWREVLAQEDHALSREVQALLAGEEVSLPLPWP